jgi:putative oxidoreductase
MSAIKEFYQGIIAAGESFQNFLLLSMRAYWGYSFFRIGLEKLQNIKPVISMLTSLEIPFPEYSAHALAWTECVGGAFLFFGFLSRIASIPLAFAMLTAFFTAHFDAVKTMFEDPQKLINQKPFNYLLAALVVFAFGPGKYSLDTFFQRFFSKSR